MIITIEAYNEFARNLRNFNQRLLPAGRFLNENAGLLGVLIDDCPIITQIETRFISVSNNYRNMEQLQLFIDDNVGAKRIADKCGLLKALAEIFRQVTTREAEEALASPEHQMQGGGGGKQPGR